MTEAELLANVRRTPALNAVLPDSPEFHEPVSRMADAIRAFAFDGPDADRPFSLGMADVAAQLWTRVLKHDAADPGWPDRDRCLGPSGAGTAMLPIMHVLAGRETPEIGSGHGLAHAAGMALAERALAARFGRSLVDHRTWVLMAEAELSSGATHEAIWLAGHMRLEKLTALVEDPGGKGEPLKAFAAQGWATRSIDAADASQLSAALSAAMRSKKPMAIACRIGPLPQTREVLGLPSCGLPEPLRALWRDAGGRGAAARRSWLKRTARHPLRAELERVIAGRLPDTWRDTAGQLRAGEFTPADLLGHAALPEFVGDLGAGSGARSFAYGGRMQAMASAMGGISLHGGLIPCGTAPLAGSDAIRPALREAVAARLRTIFLLTDGDEDTADHLAGLRAIPGAFVFRPADDAEAAECWDLALRRAEGPSVILAAPANRPAASPRAAGCGFGGYAVCEPDRPRRATLIASGAQLSIAAQACTLLGSQGVPAALVSLPCWELFAVQDEAYRERTLGAAPRFGIEAGCGFGWSQLLGPAGLFVQTTAEAAHGSSPLSAEALSATVVRRLGL